MIGIFMSTSLFRIVQRQEILNAFQILFNISAFKKIMLVFRFKRYFDERGLYYILLI
jgi:hypothetical protein